MYNYEWDRLKTWLDQYGAIDDNVTKPEEIVRLDLSGHKLKSLPESFGILSKLLVLNLANNQLSTLPESMKNLPNLSNLDIRRNSFELLPPLLTSLPLRSLNASGNKITDISLLGACRELRVLDMSSNSLKELGIVFGVENELRTLNLSNNFLKELDAFFSTLGNLQRLNLNGNLISKLSSSISSLVSLEEIEMTDTLLESIDEAFFELEIESINFTANKLSNLHLHGLDSLEVLILDENPLEKLSMSEDFAPYLRELSCDWCGLTKFVLPPSKMLENLCYSSNEISQVPDEIERYTKLSQLDLESNNIVDLPNTLANILHLKTLYIKDNPLSENAKKIIAILDPEICDLKMKSGITIELAQKDDLETMAKLLSILFTIETDFQIDFNKQLSGITKLYENEGSDLLVAKYENHVVGMVTMQRLISSAEGDYVGQIEDLVVQDEYRKMGVGSRLINKMRSIAQEHGYKRIQLGADVNNSNALQFYTRRGFSKTHLNIYRYIV